MSDKEKNKIRYKRSRRHKTSDKLKNNNYCRSQGLPQWVLKTRTHDTRDSYTEPSNSQDIYIGGTNYEKVQIPVPKPVEPIGFGIDIEINHIAKEVEGIFALYTGLQEVIQLPKGVNTNQVITFNRVKKLGMGKPLNNLLYGHTATGFNKDYGEPIGGNPEDSYLDTKADHM